MVFMPTIKAPTMSAPTKSQFLASLTPIDCCICKEGFNKDHKPVTLDCRHVFGGTCLEMWVTMENKNNTCPCCRAVLFVPDPTPEELRRMLPTEIWDSTTEEHRNEQDQIYLERYDPGSYRWLVLGPPNVPPQHWDGESAREFAREFLPESIQIGEQLGPHFDVDDNGFIMAFSPMLADREEEDGEFSESAAVARGEVAALLGELALDEQFAVAERHWPVPAQCYRG